jgi:hypothetical protein
MSRHLPRHRATDRNQGAHHFDKVLSIPLQRGTAGSLNESAGYDAGRRAVIGCVPQLSRDSDDPPTGAGREDHRG